MFQSTFPQGERPSPSRPSSRQARFQSTFPQGERQNRWRNAILTNGVSIHVPTRGTTLQCIAVSAVSACCNPRSHKGNDTARKGARNDKTSFNPRSHKGNDLIRTDRLPVDPVSIHVPTRGTTSFKNLASLFDAVSIHVPTRGTTMSLKL